MLCFSSISILLLLLLVLWYGDEEVIGRIAARPLSLASEPAIKAYSQHFIAQRSNRIGSIRDVNCFPERKYKQVGGFNISVFRLGQLQVSHAGTCFCTQNKF